MSVAAIQKPQHSPSHSVVTPFERASCAVASSSSSSTTASSGFNNHGSRSVFSTPTIGQQHYTNLVTNNNNNNFSQILTTKLDNLPDTIAAFSTYNGVNLNISLPPSHSTNLFTPTSNLNRDSQDPFLSNNCLVSGNSLLTAGMTGADSGNTCPPGSYIFSSNSTLCNLSGGDSSAHSSNSSSRTRLVGMQNNDSGLSTLSSNNGGGAGSSLLLPSNMNQTIHLPAGFGSPDLRTKPQIGMPALGGGMDEVDDLEPQPRDRCNTWPMRRPTLDINAQTSPLIHDLIPEEESVFDESHEDNLDDNCDMVIGEGVGGGLLGSPSRFSDEMSPMRSDSALEGDSTRADSPPTSKKSTTRRNAWGNMSYADLITQAILNSPDKRLTLSQVYEWMVQNVPYFRDKGDSNSSAGWKNSIRHNLSLHSRFMRIQNEGAGKSSWWVINPEAKSGRNPRRRAATMESNNKAMEKKRRGARKRGMEMRLHSGNPSAMSSQSSMLSSQELYNECDDLMGSNFEGFRPRTQSTISIPGPSSRVSPTQEPPGFEDFDFSPWMDTQREPQRGAGAPNTQGVNELLDRTDHLRLDCGGSSVSSNNPASDSGLRTGNLMKSMNNGNSSMQSQILQQQPQQLSIKSEDIKPDISGVQPPPSYQELSVVRGNSQQQLQQNPLLRNVVSSSAQVIGSPQQKLLSNIPQTGLSNYYATLTNGPPGSNFNSHNPHQPFRQWGAPPHLLGSGNNSTGDLNNSASTPTNNNSGFSMLQHLASVHHGTHNGANNFGSANTLHGMTQQTPFSCASSASALNHQPIAPCMDVENLDSTLLAQNVVGLDMEALLLEYSQDIHFDI